MIKKIKVKNIKSGDILLVNSKGFVQDAIHEFQGNKYNHAGFFIYIANKLYVFESIKQGQAFTLFKDYLKRQEEKKCKLLVLQPKNNEFKDIKINDIINFVLPLTHKPYGFMNLFIYQPIKFIGKWLGKDWWIGGNDNKRNFICGELVAYIYNHFLGWFKDWYRIAPVKLFESAVFNKFEIKL